LFTSLTWRENGGCGKWRVHKRISKWAEHRECLTDEAFYNALNLPSIPKDAAVSVRPTVSDAVRIPKELIGPNDTVSELEGIGDPSHQGDRRSFLVIRFG